MVITRKGFTQIVSDAFAGLGFPAEGPIAYEFPLEMFLPSSDLSPIEENIDKVIWGLTQWEPQRKTKGVMPLKMITVKGKDYLEAVTHMNNLFLRNLWSDGLPILPATEERVNWILTGTDLPADKVVGEGKILPIGGIATVKSIAVVLAMAGGRPEYLPVLIAAVEAITRPEGFHQHWSSTTNSTYPAVIVNGPVAKQIRLNSGYGCLGPSSEYPAGAAIGRAIRFLLMDIGGAIPGIGTMSTYGGPARYANIVFAEDEDGIPPDWQPLNVSYWDSPRGSNTLTVLPVSSTVNISGHHVGDEETALVCMNMYAGFMRSPYNNYFQKISMYEGAPGILLIPRGAAQVYSRLGWTKEKIKNYLWKGSIIPWTDIVKWKSAFTIEDSLKRMEPYLERGKPWPITSKAKNIMIVVAGGEQSGHGYWMQLAQSVPTRAKIILPQHWDILLEQAENDLGPLRAR